MILHIFKKDVRRLWPAISASLIVLASLAWHDRWREDRMAGEIEGYLNLLVPLVWACLLALAVEQEPLVGDRQFWITRPYRRRDLLVAKLLFAALFVHAPSLLADCWILQGRGFPAIAYAGELLTKQFVQFCAITLPAMALAAVVRSFSHFVLEVVAVAAAALILASAKWTPAMTWEVFETVRWQSVVAVAAVAAGAIVPLQYLARRLRLSRAIAIAAGLAAALLFLFFRPTSAFAIRSSLDGAGVSLSVRMTGETPDRSTWEWAPLYGLVVPVEVGGVPEGMKAGVTTLSSTIAGAGGTYEQSASMSYRPFERQPFYLGFTASNWTDAVPKWMRVNIDPSVFGKLKGSPLTISGQAGVTLYRPRPSVWMGTSETRDFGDVGRCVTQMVERRFGEPALKVECESPRNDLAGTQIRLWSPETGLERRYGLGGARTVVNGPRNTWLSPLYREVAYIELIQESSANRYEWRVSRALIPNARIEITRLESVGYAPLRYEFRDVDPARYTVRRPTNSVVAK